MIKIVKSSEHQTPSIHGMFGEKYVKRMVDAALAVRKQAYAPYSKYQVGAAILAASGRIYVGCNVECADYDGTHAEEAALAAMVAAGERTPLAVLVYGGLEDAIVTPQDARTPPCGKCRQKLLEFASLSGYDLGVARWNEPIDEGDTYDLFFELVPISKVLPEAFGPANIGVDLAKYRR